MYDRCVLHSLVFESLDEQIAVIDEAGEIIDVNSAWKVFGVENGLSAEVAWVGTNYLEVLLASASSGDELAAKAAKGISDILNGQRSEFRLEYPCHSPEEKRWFMMRMAVLKQDEPRLFVISHHNITQRKLTEDRARHLALHDPLTGLANRRYFNDFLNNEMRRSARHRSTVSLVAVDVDNFKGYNDELGHPAGDRCLVDIGRVLLKFAHRPGDLAARLGGDEFALILGDTGSAETHRIAREIRSAVHDLNLVFGRSRRVTVSVGVASVIPSRGQTCDYLLREADQALYTAKSAGRNQVAGIMRPTVEEEP